MSKEVFNKLIALNQFIQVCDGQLLNVINGCTVICITQKESPEKITDFLKPSREFETGGLKIYFTKDNEFCLYGDEVEKFIVVMQLQSKLLIP